MKNEKIKKVLGVIGSFFAGAIALLIGGLLRNNRKRANEVRDELGKAEAANNDARATVGQLKNTVESLGQSTNDVKQSIDECSNIISDVRKRGPKKED